MVQILGPNGKPLPPSKGRNLALNGYSETPYDAASSYSSEVANWTPYLGSPDNEINIYRDRIVSRVRDLVRNDGWASGGVTRILDNAVGAVFRPIVKPDYRALAFYTGNKSFDATWADEYGRAVEAAFRTWSTAEGRYCDVERKLTVSQMFRLAFRHKLIDGDALAVLQFREDRVGRGRAHFATAIQIVDPDRLSNPQQQFDLEHIRGGVELDDDGAPVAYHIRKAHVGTGGPLLTPMTWERVPRETSWGASCCRP
ncbi:phage portal protein [Citrobacter freundii]|nr:phage portal protein [Citrobacter freundii]